jgi:hypothetical protein
MIITRRRVFSRREHRLLLRKAFGAEILYIGSVLYRRAKVNEGISHFELEHIICNRTRAVDLWLIYWFH